MKIFDLCEDVLSMIAQYLPFNSRIALATTCKALYFTSLISSAAEHGFRSLCLHALDDRIFKPLHEPSSRHSFHPAFKLAMKLYSSLRCPTWRSLWCFLCQYGNLIGKFRGLSEANSRGSFGKIDHNKTDNLKLQIVTRVDTFSTSKEFDWSVNSNYSLDLHVYFYNNLPCKLIGISCEDPSRIFEVRALKRRQGSYSQLIFLFCEIKNEDLLALNSDATNPIRRLFATWLVSLSINPVENPNLIREKVPRVFALEKLSQKNLNPDSISSEISSLSGVYSALYGSHGIELLHLSIEDHNNDVMEDSVIESASYVSNDFSVSCDEVVDCLSNGSWPPFITRDKNTISKKALSNPSFIDRSFQSVIAPYVVDEDKDDEEESLRIQPTEDLSVLSETMHSHVQLIPYVSRSKEHIHDRRQGVRSTSEVAVDPRSSTFFYPQGSKYLSRNFEPGLRLVARKILGDPNVPSGFISFSCDLSSTFQTDVPERSDPVFVFKRVGRRFVSSVFDLSQQPILTKFQGIGYINVLPSKFSPQVLPGSLYLFDSSSTIFRDDDSSNDSKRDDIQERLITKNRLPHIAFCWNDPDDVSHLTILNRF